MNLSIADNEWIVTRVGSLTQVVPLTPDASSRRYYRIKLPDQSTFVVVKEAPFEKTSHNFLNMQQHYHSFNLLVPNIYFIEPQKGLIIQQDLGDQSLNQWLCPESQWDTQQMGSVLPMSSTYRQRRQAHIGQQMELLKSVQQISKPNFWGSAPLVFDQAKFSFEWGWTLTHLMEPALPSLASLFAGWLSETALVSQYLSARARVFVHRDLHSRNIMMNNEQMYLIDFQDSRWGSPYYDLVSLIFDSYLPIDQDLEMTYLESFKLKHSEYFDQKEYLYQAVQRTFKACGSFASFWMRQQDRRYIPYIKPTLLHTHRLLKQTPELPTLNSLVEQLLTSAEWS